jgi:DNA recombination protein RmuC
VALAQVDAAACRVERDAAADERDRLREQHAAVLADLRKTRDELVGAEARLAGQEELLAKQRELEEQVKEAFTRLSGEALQKTQAQFLDLADHRFKQAGRPLTETLTKVEQQMQEIERNRAEAQGVLRQQIESVRLTGEQLKNETAALVSALRKPQARGRWGELQLKRVVELAGMTDRCDFIEQLSVTTADGMLRPDLVVRLVGDKSIVVDSKVTLAAYLEAYDAADDDTRDARLAAHAKHLRQHVDALAAKSYWSQFSPAPEFVVLFVPGDPFLAAALDRDGTLLDDAFAKRVHIATPTTLISVLRAVAYAWQQEALAENAREVFELGRELYKRLGTMGGHVDKLGRSIARAVTDYNTTVGSLESQVMSSARKLNELHVVDTALPEMTGLDSTIRPLTKSELVDSAEQARAVKALPGVPDAAVDELEPDRTDDYGIDAGGGAAERDRRTGS